MAGVAATDFIIEDIAAPAIAGEVFGGSAAAELGSIGIEGAAGGAAAADAAGLAQMAADAGLTGQAATDFVASGGTAGSTAAGGGGVGTGAAVPFGPSGGAGNTPLDVPPGGAPPAAAGGPSFIPATNNLTALNTAQAGALGVTPAGPGLDTSIWTGEMPTDVPNPLSDVTIPPTDETALDLIKKAGGSAIDWIGKNPATAGMLGLSAYNSLRTPKLPDAAKRLNETAGPNAAAASAMIQSGGTGGPQWPQQKASIDATIDQQIKQQTEAMLQQAVNSGQGADSQVTLQQIDKLKNNLETQRQQLYMQAQQQNVQVALRELGISDQALSQVAATEFAQSREAQSSAAQTAELAMLMNSMQKPTAGATT